ncbi:MAG: hydroxymethylglutaryl-CoA lyase [Bacteriovoracia bacterium]
MAGKTVNVFEVGPRDGFQNESRFVSLGTKIGFIEGLVAAGIRDLELGAFVRPDRVPQMSDTDAIFQAIREKRLNLKSTRAWSLVPNRKGLERAIAAGAKHIAVFTAASETFVKKNIRMSIQESLDEFAPLVKDARKAGMTVRGYISTAFGCPFEGKIAPKKVLKVVQALAKMGVSQISLGDTIGVASPRGVTEVVKPTFRLLGVKKTAVHFHDTRGTALANTLRSLDIGVRTVDSSAGGLGGCPFAPGASGNLATEDLVFMLEDMGMDTGIQLEKLAQVSLNLAQKMGRPLSSRYLQARASSVGVNLSEVRGVM